MNEAPVYASTHIEFLARHAIRRVTNPKFPPEKPDTVRD